ncbi:hypothetical protein GVN20_21565 [Runella sp. CRIBMP]|uniref:hypothetical protein n=1 Tax=Runella sp. CRIBMP TaxID=2683261 RepID=UPI00141367CD|nr:hypothetical protein [Runella sp. CRIBMP]NBB21962.1 hypothetical protein [Runella sp. CRIBMP]
MEKYDPRTQFEKGKIPLGLYDMSSNLWQLTESERTDGYNNYCILRGGAWYVNCASEWYANQGAQTLFRSQVFADVAGLGPQRYVRF